MPTGRVAAYPAAPALENPVEGGGWLRTEIEIAYLENVSKSTYFYIIISTKHVSVLPKLSFLCVPGLFCALKHGKKIDYLC